MYNPDTDFIFPSRVIPALRDRKGAQWQELVDRANEAPLDDPEHLSFILMMVGLNGCESCNADSYKAMRGCTPCSIQSIDRYSGSEDDLQNEFESAREKLKTYQNTLSE